MNEKVRVFQMRDKQLCRFAQQNVCPKGFKIVIEYDIFVPNDILRSLCLLHIL